MKRFFTLTIALSFLLTLGVSVLPSTALAQQMPEFDPAKMEEMIKQFQNPEAMKKLQEQAEAAGRCMENIDENQLNALQARAEAASEEIQKLCDAGQRDQALRKGLKLSQELQNNAAVKKVSECSRQLGDTMKNLPWAETLGLGKLDSDSPAPTLDDICR